MNTNTIRGLASIIVPCFNQRGFTQLCLQSLYRYTRAPWELIVVDNGSTDDTKTYLAGVLDATAVPVTVVANARNLGFPAAINQGLQVARGEYLVLLNNDAVVTEGWLDQLIALANAKSHVTVETAETKTESENGNLAIVDFNHDSSGAAGAIGPSPQPSPAGEGASCSRRDGSHAGHARTLDGPDRLDSTIGLAGPMSNYAAPPQLVERVPYHDLEEMHRFARCWRDEHRGQWFTVPKLSGFCLLMKRAVYDAIGGLDERFGLGLFDDDDLAERARRAGFELAVAHDLFIHHFGSRTFAGNGIDAEKLLDENARRFAAKWGLPVTKRRRVVLRPWNGSSDPNTMTPQALDGAGEDSARNGPKLATNGRGVGQAFEPDVRLESLTYGKQCRVSLTMIVKDEENNLSTALESVAGLFDEIVVVDTGSTDRTIEIARSFGARVFDFVWVDDFGAARNAALARATGDYAFWLDADDVVDPPEQEKLRALLDQLRAGDEACHVVRCKCDPSPDGSGGETVVDHIRLFPLRQDVRWTYRVHEQILPALKRAGVPVRWTGVTVRHTGYVDKALRARKLDRDHKILTEDLEDRPDDPFTLFNLGSIAVERQDWLEALGFLRRSLAGSAPTDSITRKLFALIARVYQMQGDSQTALRTCADGLAINPDDAELWFRKAVVHRHRGESAEAEGCWRRILTLHRPEQFSSVDQGIYGHVTRRNLAAIAAERGDHAEAAKLWTEVLAECPGDREALAKLKDLSLVLGP
ncbi:MAG: glycosyltransferase [Isosphaerales bacterium]